MQSFASPEPMEEPGRRTAILVIHGIGEQNPYETLDSFARGLSDHLTTRGCAPRLEPERIRHDGWTEVAIHLDTGDRTGEMPSRISLFEFYWAPYTEAKVTYREVFWWLLATASRPLRYLTSNLQELLEVKDNPGPAAFFRLFRREILRMVAIYLPVVVLLGLVGAAFVYRPDIPGLVAALRELVRKEAHPWRLVLIGALGLLTVVMLNVVWQVRSHRRNRRAATLEEKAEGWIRPLAIGGAAIGAVLTGLTAMTLSEPLSAYVAVFFRPKLALLVPAVAFAWILKRIFVDFLGDVAIYTTADEKAKNFEARSAILKNSTDAVARLLACPDFDEVVIAGHSLGSVIAYDTVNRLLALTLARPDGASGGSYGVTSAQLQRLTGLVTFGCPLGKIYYFFRQQIGRNQAVRAQIISLLHGYGRRPSQRNYKPYELALGRPDGVSGRPDLPDLRWINVWSRMDPISGPLEFYDVPPANQLHRWYRTYGLAHLSYWNDDRFYGFVCDHLMLRARPAEAASGPSSS